MEDLRIPGIVRAIVFGWFGGMPLFGGLGLLLFGPINGSSDIWGVIGGVLGAAFYVNVHFERKKERSEQNGKLK